ncbi:hypothetical protein D9M71_467390 [compost metagenome]
MGLGDGFLSGFAPVDISGIDVGGNDQDVRIQFLGQQCGAEVLVDHRLDAAEFLAGLVIHGRDAASARADDHGAFLQQPFHRTDLEDPLRSRTGDNAPELVAIWRDMPAFFLGQGFGFLFRVDRADGLGRVLEGRVLRVHFDLGEDGGERDLEGQQVAHFLLDHVADHAFGFGAEHVQRIGGDLVIGGALQGQQANLRAVAVGDHQFVAGLHLGDLLRRDLHIHALIVSGHGLATAQQGVTAQSDDDTHKKFLQIATGRAAPALTGTARPGRWLHVGESRDEDRLDGVHAVFRLLEGDAVGRLEDVLGDFDAVLQVRILLGDLLADLGFAVVEGR